MDNKKSAISVSINLEGLDPSVKKQVKVLLEERDKFKNKYLKWKTRCCELDRWHKQLQEMYKENMKELQKHVGY